VKPLCVLLHGYPNNTMVWKEQLPVLKEKFQILNIALPGSETGRVEKDQLKLGRLITSIVQEIESHDAKEIILIGHDIGAFILSEVSKRFGPMIKAQIFLAGMDFGLFKERLRTSPQFLKSWYVLLFQMPVLPEKLVPAFRKELSREIYKDSPDLSHEAPEGFTPVAIYRELKNGFQLSDLREKSKTPTLFLFGEGDRFILPPQKIQIAEFYENATIKVIPGGHWFMRENVEVVNETINNFLSMDNV
jgi:epoxide hydrolase 4